MPPSQRMHLAFRSTSGSWKQIPRISDVAVRGAHQCICDVGYEREPQVQVLLRLAFLSARAARPVRSLMIWHLAR